MAVRAKHLFCAIIICVTINESCSLDIDYLGSSLTHEEYQKREFCSTKVCMEDNDRLVYAATRNSSIEPCVDFKTFAVGEFLKHRVLNDRYIYIGFQNDVNRLLKERQRIILNDPIKDDDPRMFTVLKNFFRKCVNSDLVRKQGGDDMITHLKQFGGSPLVSNGTWKEVDFETKNLFTFEPHHSLFLFLSHKLSRCKDPRDEESDIVCFKMDDGWTFSTIVEKDTNEILKTVRLEESAKQVGVKDFIEFLLLKKPIQLKLSKEGKPKVFSINELTTEFPELGLDWLNIINSQLLQQSQVSAEDEIMIENPELLKNLLTSMAKLEPNKIANIFATTFFYEQKEAFIVYSFNRRDAYRRGTKQSYQRFEQCIYYLESNMRPAMEALTAKKYYDSSLQASGRELIMEGVADVISRIKRAKDVNNKEVKKNLIAKLEAINLIVMFPDDILNPAKIQEMYEELSVDGSESLVELYVAISKHNRKLLVLKSTSWIKHLQKTLTAYESNYDAYQNVMFIPSKSLLYPYYHPERSRFFNMVTLYKSAVQGLNKGIRRYLQQEMNKTFCCLIENALLADENYVRWEANGGKERELSAFKLTNRQMLWFCSAYRFSSKYHYKAPKTYDAAARLQIDYLHVRYKKQKRFRDAFNCGEMTTEEKLSFEDFGKKNLMLLGIKKA